MMKWKIFVEKSFFFVLDKPKKKHLLLKQKDDFLNGPLNSKAFSYILGLHFRTKELSLCHKLKFLILASLQTNGIHLWYLNINYLI